MIGEDHVALCALPVNLVDAAPAARANETPHSALIHDLQGLDEVRVVEEVQGGQVLVGESPGGRDGLKQLLPQAFHGDLLHSARQSRALASRRRKGGAAALHCWRL